MSEGKVMQTGNQNKTKVSVQGVPETMLQTLFAEKKITISMMRKQSRSYPG